MIKTPSSQHEPEKDPKWIERLSSKIGDLGIRFKNQSLLETAFVHSSFRNENPEYQEHNERLEFLGDSVLGLVVAKYLFHKHPNASEGELSRRKAKLVSTAVLNGLSEELGINDFVMLGKGEGQGNAQKKLGANLFEALIGAIYLDQGMDTAENFIVRHLFEFAKRSDSLKVATDYKTVLQEICQKKFKHLPTYRLLKETGPDHEKIFYVSVHIRDKYSAEGQGRNKKYAEQDAARRMLQILKIKT